MYPRAHEICSHAQDFVGFGAFVRTIDSTNETNRKVKLRRRGNAMRLTQ